MKSLPPKDWWRAPDPTVVGPPPPLCNSRGCAGGVTALGSQPKLGTRLDRPVDPSLVDLYWLAVFTRHRKPVIVNTDQGSQFTAQAFVQTGKDRGWHLSMDGGGAWRDNVFVKRLWKSVKYERVYLHAYDSVSEARQSIRQYLGWYNQSRPYSSLDQQTPDEAYAVMLPTGKLAA